MITREALREFIHGLVPEIREMRHELHRIPELAGKEHETRRLLKAEADKLQPIYWQPKLGTDLVFEIPGRDPGKVIGLRADMDALPILEKTGVGYVSGKEGLMHACGHDGHMSILMGTAKVAKFFEKHLPVTVRFIFQPGEEVLCMGAELVEKGVCDGLSSVYGFHNWPGLPVGKISSKPGIFFAAANDFKITFRGTATHGATPEKGNNPLLPAADAVIRLQGAHQRFSREESAVISVCSVQGGKNSNVIPAAAVLEGTIRYTSMETGKAIEAAIQDEVRTAAENSAVEYTIEFNKRNYLPVINDENRTKVLQTTVEKMLGSEAYIPAEMHTMGAEDFAFYLTRTPGCMFWLGAGVDHAPIHSDTFDFTDESIAYGIQVLSALMFGDKLE
jgi:hippurate hydrolase